MCPVAFAVATLHLRTAQPDILLGNQFETRRVLIPVIIDNSLNAGLEQFKNYCSRASTGRAALQRRVPADPSPPSRLQPAAPRLHK
jgi:hypothetical protein